MLVLKFGGTSVGSPESIQRAIRIVLAQPGVRAVVCSAFGGATDQLIQMAQLAAQRNPAYRELLQLFERRHLDAVAALIPAQQREAVAETTDATLDKLRQLLNGIFLVRELTARTLDFISGFGERLSAALFAEAIRPFVPEVEFLDTRSLIKTDDRFGSALVQFEITNEWIRRHFSEHPGLQIATGFIGSTMKDETTTLGRGGSDYTAAILGAALDCAEIQIWTDVDGILTADPRKVKNAFLVPEVSYEEAMEMAHFGAKVIYPPTMAPAMGKSIPILIKNTWSPDSPGTLIANQSGPRPNLACGISSIDHIALVLVQGCSMIGIAGICSRLFHTLAQRNINIILISQASSEHSICLAVAPRDAQSAREALTLAFAVEIHNKQINEIEIQSGMSVIAVVGTGLHHRPGAAARIFSALGGAGINVAAIAQGSSELNVSLVVSESDLGQALNVLHDAFFYDECPRLHFFLAGIGLVGKTLLRQHGQHLELLRARVGEPICIGLANSKSAHFDPTGLFKKDQPIEHQLHELLEKPGEKPDAAAILRRLAAMRLPNKVLVDCTAGSVYVEHYREALEAGISVVTPNKLANCLPLPQYRELRRLARRPNVSYLSEATVGAGLPVISTLRTLMDSGDRLLRIEAVLSGSISFILNSVSAERTFSQVVLQARSHGYTEPDPREDLCGLDAARKILILTREAGFSLELAQVEVESLVPEPCQDAQGLADFLEKLPQADAAFESRRAAAQARGCRLRYLARFEGGKAELRLLEVDADHPCYGISGTENLVSFWTERYSQSPLVVRGPGAGAEVTAAQVLADLLHTAK